MAAKEPHEEPAEFTKMDDRISDFSSRDYSPLLELPCLSWEKDESDATDTSKAPSITPQPSVDEVRAFVDELTQPFLDSFTDMKPAEAWWQPFDSDGHPTPSSDWANELDGRSFAQLVEYAAACLGGAFAGLVVRRWKSSSTYPEGWGNGPADFRSLPDRLFDRLHVNHELVDGRAVRIAGWYDVEGARQAPQSTVIAARDGDNSWGQLLRIDAENGGQDVLVRLLGVKRPSSYVFPLPWEEATHSGLFLGLEATLSSSARGLLGGLADDLVEAADELRAGRGRQRLVSTVRTLTATSTAAVAAAWLVLALSEVLSTTLVEDLEGAADAIVDAAERGLPLDGVLRELLLAIGWVDLHPMLLGISEEDALLVSRALGRSDFVESGVIRDRPVPVVHLGGDMSELGDDFGDFETIGSTGRSDVATHHSAARSLWVRWREATQPTLDAARLFDGVGILVEKLVEMDDTVLAMVPLAGREGLLAGWVRTFLYDEGLANIADVFGGIWPPAVLRHLVRQVLTDNFIGHFVDKGYSRACLEDLFCWMSSRAERDRIDAALGPVMEIELGDLVADPSNPSRAEQHLLAESQFTTLFVRACLLAESERELDRPLVGTADPGALGRLFQAYAEGGFTASGFDSAADPCDLAAVRDWLGASSAACLHDLVVWPDFDLREREAGRHDPEDIEIEVVPEFEILDQEDLLEEDDDEGVIRP